MVRVRSGLRTLIGYSEKRKHTTLQEYLCEQDSSLQPKKVHIHESCRCDYTNYLRLPERVEGNNINEPLVPKTRPSTCLIGKNIVSLVAMKHVKILNIETEKLCTELQHFPSEIRF